MLKPSFGFDSPTYFSRHELSVLVDPRVGFVARITVELVQSHIRVTGQNFGVERHEIHQVMVLGT